MTTNYIRQNNTAGWGKIDFNWKNGGTGTNANFFGCNTGATGTGIVDYGTAVETYDIPSFANRVSSLPNFQNVTVAGQTSSAYPSQFTNFRLNSQNGTDNFINSESNGMVYFQRTYLVGGEHSYGGLNTKASQNVANPMQLNTNGQTTGTNFQQGTTR